MPGVINQLTGTEERMPPPDLTRAQYDALMTLLEDKPYTEHLHWNGREYFLDGGELWVMAWRERYDSGDTIERPER